MLYIHENNLKSKINSNYKNKGEEIKRFYEEVYIRYREQLKSLDYISKDLDVFKKAAKLIDEYLIKVEDLSSRINITSQSKFKSTFIEEISTYLFSALPLIRDNTFGIYNKNIYAGMKINNHMHIDIISKDVDFCVGKKVELKVDETQKLSIIIPIVCVEVKTYLDATMFGEVQYSSRQIKNASPNVKTYVLMEYNDVSKEKIIAARYDNNLNEMFVLRSGSRKDSVSNTPMDPAALLEYYEEVSTNIEHAEVEDIVNDTGRLLNR